MDPPRSQRSGLYRPKLARRALRCISDEKFNELFAALGSQRDRALVAFWVSTRARAAELLVSNSGGRASPLVIACVPFMSPWQPAR
jgi:hypothetical protein